MRDLTNRHQDLLAKYESCRAPWAAVALYACLAKIAAGEVALLDTVDVLDAWTNGDEILVTYRYPYFDGVLGIRRGAESPNVLYFGDSDAEGRPEPATFGGNVAEFDIGEPMGNYAALVKPDASGVHWWGDPDFL